MNEKIPLPKSTFELFLRACGDEIKDTYCVQEKMPVPPAPPPRWSGVKKRLERLNNNPYE